LPVEQAALAFERLLTLDRLPDNGTGQQTLTTLLRRHGLRPSKVA
jgi:hypothetical protein